MSDLKIDFLCPLCGKKANRYKDYQMLDCFECVLFADLDDDNNNIINLSMVINGVEMRLYNVSIPILLLTKYLQMKAFL